MKSKLPKLIMLVVFTSLLFACNVDFVGIKGKGEIITKDITLDQHFSEIKTESGWRVKLVKSSENKITIRAHENLIEQLDNKIDDNRLTIGSKNNIQSGTREITLYYTEDLQLIKSSSGSTISSEDIFNQKEIKIEASSGSLVKLNLKVKQATVDVSSGANIKLKGTSIYFEGEASSGSRIYAENLKTKECKVKASSGAGIDIYNEGYLEASVSSGATIDYYGNPEKVSANESNSGGRIKHQEN